MPSSLPLLKRIPPTAREGELFTAEPSVGAFSHDPQMVWERELSLSSAPAAAPAGFAGLGTEEGSGQAVRALQWPCPPDPMGDIISMLFRLSVLPVICPHALQTHRECAFKWSARLQLPALPSRPFAVPGNRSREEALTLCLCIALTQHCDNPLFLLLPTHLQLKQSYDVRLPQHCWRCSWY